MPIDTEALKDEIRLMSDLLEWANNPKARAMLERFVTPNGNGNGAHIPNKPANPQVSLNLESPPANPQKRKYGLMAECTYAALSSTAQTPVQIAAAMVAKGFKFEAKETPKYAVADALRNLEGKGKAKRAPGKADFGATLWTRHQ